MTATMVRKGITKKEAEALWSRLENLFANLEQTLEEIIAKKAWEPLGFKSFHEAYAARLSKWRIPSELLTCQVIYAMLDEGAAVEEIADAVYGATDKSVGVLARKKRINLPLEHTSQRTRRKVRQTLANPARPPRTIHITPSPRDYERFCDIATDLGMTVQELGKEAVRIVVDRGGIE